jgi:hypothetical protein
MPLATRFRKQVNTAGDTWAAVVESTGQPFSFDLVEEGSKVVDASRVRATPAPDAVGK